MKNGPGWTGWRLRTFLVLTWLWAAAAGSMPVEVDYYYEPGCSDCERIEQEVLPGLKEQFGASIQLNRRDIGRAAEIADLIAAEEECGWQGPGRLYLVVGRQYGFGRAARLEEVRDKMVSLQEGPAAQPLRDPPAGDPVRRRYAGFVFYAVAMAGLLDGINPCAISTLVFFMSLLAAARVRNRDLLSLGAAFCAASFVTYLAIGFGLFRALHLFSGFAMLRRGAEVVMAALLLVLAGLSFRDAARFRKSGRAADVTLQLSSGMKRRIHRVMRRGLGLPGMVSAGLLIGSAVTVLESVCTGQIYVPTLVVILRESQFSNARAWLMLLLYNLFFILPLVTVFVAVYRGLQMEALSAWSRRNVVLSKTMAGIFFLLMAWLLFHL